MMTLTAPWIGQLGHRAAEGGVAGLMRRISRDELQTAGLHKHYSVSLVALVAALCAREPGDRPSLASVLSWPMLREYAPPPQALPRIQQQPSRQRQAEPAGIDQHAAALAIQRSFKRSANAKRDRVAHPTPYPHRHEHAPRPAPERTLSEGEVDVHVDISDPDNLDVTMPVTYTNEPSPSACKGEQSAAAMAAAGYARQAALDAANAALRARPITADQHVRPTADQRARLYEARQNKARQNMPPLRMGPPQHRAPPRSGAAEAEQVDSLADPPTTEEAAGFIAAPAFVGYKGGYIFKRAERGLGYYLDIHRNYHLPVAATPTRALEQPQTRAAPGGRAEPAPPSSRPMRPSYAAAVPLGQVPAAPAAGGLGRVPSSGRLASRVPPSGGLSRAPSAAGLARVPSAAALARVPSAAAGLGRGQPVPSTSRVDNQPTREAEGPLRPESARVRGHAAAVAAAQAAKKAMQAAKVARVAADDLRAAADAKQQALEAAKEAKDRAVRAIRPAWQEPESAEPATRRRDPVSARRALRDAMDGGRPTEVAAAAAAAQKIIDSFKRSQMRRRDALRALPPHQRQTLNRRIAAREQQQQQPRMGPPAPADRPTPRGGPGADALKRRLEYGALREDPQTAQHAGRRAPPVPTRARGA